LTSRFSPIMPICVEESFGVEDGVDIGLDLPIRSSRCWIRWGNPGSGQGGIRR